MTKTSLPFVTALVVSVFSASLLSAAPKADKTNASTEKPAETSGPRFAERKKIGVVYGEKVFVEYCAVCHGLHGKGDGPRSAFFSQDQYIPDLTSEGFLEGRDAELRENIRNGLARQDEPAIAMPQFKYILGANEIESVLQYVKTLSPKPETTKAVKSGSQKH